MKVLKEHLKNRSYSHVYLLTGEEKFLMNVYLNRFIDQIFDGQDKTMNMDKFTKEIKDFNVIESSIVTLPFFADKRVVVLEDIGLFDKKKAMGQQLVEVLPKVSDTSICFILEEKIDKRSKLYKYINKSGIVADFPFLKESELINYIGRELKKNDLKISSRTCSHFLHNVGYDLNTINIELSKLIDYVKGEEIVEIEHIDHVCIKHLEARIFDLVDATGNKNRKLALNLFNDMMSLKEPSTRILFMISRQIQLLYQVKLIEDRRVDKQTIAKELKLPSFVVDKLKRQSHNFTHESLRDILKGLVELEYGFKRGQINLETGIELMIIEMSQATVKIQ